MKFKSTDLFPGEEVIFLGTASVTREGDAVEYLVKGDFITNDGDVESGTWEWTYTPAHPFGGCGYHSFDAEKVAELICKDQF